jgi:hypothetical protein
VTGENARQEPGSHVNDIPVSHAVFVVRGFGLLGFANAESAHLCHEDVAQFAAPVRMPSVVGGRSFVFEARVINGVSVSHVRARRQGDDASAVGGTQLGQQVVNLSRGQRKLGGRRYA